MCDKYARIGFKTAYKNCRYRGHHVAVAPQHKNIQTITPELFDKINQYDCKYFPASRSRFLEAWLYQPTAKSLVFIEQGSVLGYGVIRQCFEGFKISPLFAENTEVAEALFQALLNHTFGRAFFLDFPEPNEQALKLAQSYDMTLCFETLRMYTKDAPDNCLNNIYGMTTFELG